MMKKCLSLVLTGLLIQMICLGPVLARSTAEKEARWADKVKASVLKLGTGESALVKVMLRDQTKLEGYISEVGESRFVITNVVTGIATPVTYPQVKQIKGNNLSTNAKIAIGAGIAAAAFVIIYAAVKAN